MKIKKTIKAKIVALTNIKREQLEKEYQNIQKLLRGENAELHSANRQQALRFYKKIKPDKEYPLSIRKDLIKIEKKDTKIANYWVRIPVKERKGGLWLAVKPHSEIPDDVEICESKIKKHKGNFFINIAIQKEVSDIQIPNNPTAVAVDLGERYIATTVSVAQDGKIEDVHFYGKNARGIRRHYSWLRKRLGEKKLLKKIKELGTTEKRKVNDALHKISRAIVNEAKEKNAVIVLGDLKRIRNSAKGKGKRFNRIVSNMPYFTLSKYITYKAEWDRILVVIRSERRTSIDCHLCGEEGKRITQGLFKCQNQNCNLEYNADLNGAINLSKRFSEHRFENGVAFDTAHNLLSEEGISFL